MLVGPCGEAAGGVGDTADRIGPDEIPGMNRLAVVERIARQSSGIDGVDSAIDQAIWPAAIERRLVDFDAFLVFSSGTVGDSHRTLASGDSIASVILRWG